MRNVNGMFIIVGCNIKSYWVGHCQRREANVREVIWPFTRCLCKGQYSKENWLEI